VRNFWNEDLSTVPNRSPSQSNGFRAVGRIEEVTLRGRPPLERREPLVLGPVTGATASALFPLRLRKSLAGAILLHLLRGDYFVVQDHSLSPTNILPVAGIDLPSSNNSSGVKGRIPPSYQYSLIAGHWPWLRT